MEKHKTRSECPVYHGYIPSSGGDDTIKALPGIGRLIPVYDGLGKPAYLIVENYRLAEECELGSPVLQ